MTPVDSMIEYARRSNFETAIGYLKAHHSYYRKFIKDLDINAPTATAIKAFDVMSRSELSCQISSIRRYDKMTSHFQYTGGTSGKSPIRLGIFKPLLDQAEQVLTINKMDRDGKPIPLSLILAGSTRGVAPRSFSEFGLMSLPLGSREGFETAIEFLQNDFAHEGFEHRISHLGLPLQALKKLTNIVREKDIPSTAFALTSISSYAAHLSSAWKEKIEDTLGAPINDMYGFSEIPSARANFCNACKAYHFDTDVIVECINLDDGDDVSVGDIGQLVVSTLRPEFTDLPLMRYLPGDYAELTPYCELSGDIGFRFKGRIHQTAKILKNKTSTPVLFPYDVLEVIDTLPWVNRLNLPRHTGVSITEDDSYAKWRIREVELTETSSVLNLDVEIRFSPALFPDEARDIRRRIYKGVLEYSPRLNKMIAADEIKLKVSTLYPNALSPPDVFRC